jgi:hypothetical protein
MQTEAGKSQTFSTLETSKIDYEIYGVENISFESFYKNFIELRNKRFEKSNGEAKLSEDVELPLASEGQIQIEAQPDEAKSAENNFSQEDINATLAESFAPELSTDAAFDQWSCPVCTFLNDNSSTICCVCESRRPLAPGTEEVHPSSEPAVSAGWWCTACTFINPLANTR